VIINEYVYASFNEACGLVKHALSNSAAGPVRQICKNVASVALPWTEEGRPSGKAELRIVAVESGVPPLTELILLPPPDAAVDSATTFLDDLVVGLTAKPAAI
jgi:hypothetical protein